MFLNRAGVQNAYSHKVRVGNWSEEQELEELRMKEYIHRSAQQAATSSAPSSSQQRM
jgi:hypothetical protein